MNFKYDNYYNHDKYSDPIQKLKNRGLNCSMSIYEVATLEHLIQFKLNYTFIKDHTSNNEHDKRLEYELKEINSELRLKQIELERKDNYHFNEPLVDMINNAYAELEKQLQLIYEANFKDVLTEEEFGRMMSKSYTIQYQIEGDTIQCYLHWKPPKEGI